MQIDEAVANKEHVAHSTASFTRLLLVLVSIVPLFLVSPFSPGAAYLFCGLLCLPLSPLPLTPSPLLPALPNHNFEKVFSSTTLYSTQTLRPNAHVDETLQAFNQLSKRGRKEDGFPFCRLILAHIISRAYGIFVLRIPAGMRVVGVDIRKVGSKNIVRVPIAKATPR